MAEETKNDKVEEQIVDQEANTAITPEDTDGIYKVDLSKPPPGSEPVEEEVTVTPPPTPPEPEDIPPVEETEDIADYDDAPTEEQILFPDEDLGDLPSSYENTEGIDVERQLGPPISTPPPLHADAEESIDIDETMAMFADNRIQADKSPFGFYNAKQGPFNRIILKDKDMKTVFEGSRSSGTITELITEVKTALGI